MLCNIEDPRFCKSDFVGYKIGTAPPISVQNIKSYSSGIANFLKNKASRVQLFRKRSASYNFYINLNSCFSEKTLTPRSPRYKEYLLLTARLTRFLNNHTLRALFRNWLYLRQPKALEDSVSLELRRRSPKKKRAARDVRPLVRSWILVLRPAIKRGRITPTTYQFLSLSTSVLVGQSVDASPRCTRRMLSPES